VIVYLAIGAQLARVLNVIDPTTPAPDLPSSASSLAGPRPREVAVKIRPLAVKKS
jgi:hypothetical protein